jgi:hypothetical protein
MNSENYEFEQLDLWKKVRIFKVDIGKLADVFPPGEKYKSGDQV